MFLLVVFLCAYIYTMNNIDIYVSFEVAKLLKNKEFDSLIYGHYTSAGLLAISDYKAHWLTPAPTQGQALEWLRQHNIYTSIYVEKNEEGKNMWQFEFYDKSLNILATDSGLSITDYNKCVDLAIGYAVKFLMK